jgi:hypothetical protein
VFWQFLEHGTIGKTHVEKSNGGIGAKPYTFISLKNLEMVGNRVNTLVGSGILLMTSWC